MEGTEQIAIEQVGDALAGYDFIAFALLFGSYARQAAFPWSDVDIAIYATRPLELLEMGEIIATLEDVVKRDVDLVVLNDALERNPALAYHAVKEGIVLFCRDHAALVDFKRRAVLHYLDTAPLVHRPPGVFSNVHSTFSQFSPPTLRLQRMGWRNGKQEEDNNQKYAQIQHS